MDRRPIRQRAKEDHPFALGWTGLALLAELAAWLLHAAV